MTTYLCPLIGDGKSIPTAFRPAVPAGKSWASIGEVAGGYMGVTTADVLAFPTITDVKTQASVDAAKTQLVKDGKNPSPEAQAKADPVAPSKPAATK